MSSLIIGGPGPPSEMFGGSGPPGPPVPTPLRQTRAGGQAKALWVGLFGLDINSVYFRCILEEVWGRILTGHLLASAEPVPRRTALQISISFQGA